MEKEILTDREHRMIFSEEINGTKEGKDHLDRIPFASGLSIEKVVEAIKKTIIEIANCNGLGIYTTDTVPGSFQPCVNYNLSDDFHNKLIFKNNGFLSNIIKNKTPYFLTIGSLGIDERFSTLLKEYDFKECLAIPLVQRRSPIGVMLLFFRRPQVIEDNHIQYLGGLSNQLAIAIEGYQNFNRRQEESAKSMLTWIKKMLDPYTNEHSIQVSKLAFEFGRFMGLSEKELGAIKLAGLFHDIGKSAIPMEILNKPASLNSFEWEIMKRHPLKSIEIIQSIKNFKEIGKWVLHHHERWDGKGYPDGLKGEEIPLFARILSVCDAYSAMVSNRPYRKPLSDIEACEEIKRFIDRQFDPQIIEVFLTFIREKLRRAT